MIQQRKLTQVDLARMEMEGGIDSSTATYLQNVIQSQKEREKQEAIHDLNRKTKDGTISRFELDHLGKIVDQTDDPLMINMWNQAQHSFLNAQSKRVRENFDRIKKLNEDSQKKMNQGWQ